jgi:aspartyl/glutamyl-tRNA(asn/gln) amidotransferase, B subunit
MYKKTIGLEVHVELNTNSKFFSSSLNNYNSLPNHNVNYIDLAYPGTLPTLNKEAINQGIRAAILLNASINKEMHFDRKNYFYPDIPKNYQITQNTTPIGVNGYIEIEVNGVKKKIRIHDLHLEEDTAKSIHKEDKSYLDFNRAGLPLLEIVSEADMESGEEAVLYLEKLRELFLYAGISDCKIEEGSMRCDANISISKTDKLGTKVEIKNIGSISNVGIAIDKEAKRQEELLTKGEVIKEQTRRYDDNLKDTVLMRYKETGNDYRYFKEADIPMFYLTDEEIEEIKNSLPMTAEKLRKVFKENGILDINIEKLIKNKDYSLMLSQIIDKNYSLVIASNLLLGPVSQYLNETSKNILDTLLDIDRFEKILKAFSNEEIDNKMFKDMLKDFMENEEDVELIIKNYKSSLMDTDSLREIIVEIINNSKSEVEEIKAGNERKIQYLVGQTMKKTSGKVSPKSINEIINEELGKL